MSVDSASDTPTIGVLAMQGAFAEHVAAFEACGVLTVEVRTQLQLEAVDGIVIPGGESTAIRKALDRCDLLSPLRDRIAGGLPAFGTCAGMIVLADTTPDSAPPCLALLDVDVDRNGFGRQTCSSEREVQIVGGPSMTGVFIRAPRIIRMGENVRVLGTLAHGDYANEPVVVQEGAILAASFHPELTSDRALHERFIQMVRDARYLPPLPNH